jgi:hypothetical protein
MFTESFRLVTARLIPLVGRCKQARLPATVLLVLGTVLLVLGTLILAGCGGSGAAKPQEDWQSVRGPGFRFEAPMGWKVERAKARVSASKDAELVQVATFPLLKAYDAKLFDKVARELQVRMREIAGQTKGTLSGGRTVEADGIRSHAYDVTVGEQVDEYTFVLAGKREYLLLCRRASDDDASEVCRRLATSFQRA